MNMDRRDFLRSGLATALLSGARLGGAGSMASSADGTSLFDGKTLAGWHQPHLPPDDKYSGGRWRVVDGALCGEQYPAGDGRGSLLLSDAVYGDFDLSVDIWPDWGCDTGLFLRTSDRGGALQVMIDYLPGGTVGFLHGQGLGGFFSCPVELRKQADGTSFEVVDTYDAVKIDGLTFAANAATWKSAWLKDTWNTLRVTCTGKFPRVATWINGVKICEMDSATFHPRQLKDARAQNWSAPSAYLPEKIFEQLGASGRIALQVHPGNRWSPGGLTRFRNIRVRSL